MKTDLPSPDEILRKAGFALMIAQQFESSLATLCRILNAMRMTEKNEAPISDESLLGLEKVRTPALRKLKEVLSSVGVEKNHELAIEIESFVKFRDWLAHRMFIEIASSIEASRRFQDQTLDEGIEKGKAVTGMILATSKQLAESDSGKELPQTDIMAEMIAPNLERASSLITEMKAASSAAQQA